MPGDLKTIVTQEWDAATQAWVRDDINYFRYYTEDDVETGVVEHGLKRVLIPNAYAAFVAAYGAPGDPPGPTTDGLLYCGYFLDTETALYQVGTRYYDGRLSTFIRRDPIGYHGTSKTRARLLSLRSIAVRDRKCSSTAQSWRPRA